MSQFSGSAFPTPPPATLAASGVWSSGAIPCTDIAGILASAVLSQTGTLTLQRYIDNGATVAVGTLISQAMTANVVAFAGVNDGLPFGSAIITVTNTAGSVGTLGSVFCRTIGP